MANCEGQDYEKLKKWCLKMDVKFIDPTFPPDKNWVRASELVEDPKFFVGGASRFDINQGELGDCWFMSAIAALTVHKKLFKKVVPPKQYFGPGNPGIFQFKFWKYGKWIDIVIDDFLPARNGKLIYVKSTDSNEFWPALLEKAYAKLKGGYEALDGGSSLEAMINLSGGCAESDTYDLKKLKDDASIFKIIDDAFQRKAMICSSLKVRNGIMEETTEEGLVMGHAYTMIQASKFRYGSICDRKSAKLLRLRNPWGNDKEWNGKWSDQSEEWKLVSNRRKNCLDFQEEEDGEFFMDEDDFLEHFDFLNICNLTPFGRFTRTKEIHFHGSWVKDKNAGGQGNWDLLATNPQFPIEMNSKSTCLIALLQKGRKKQNSYKFVSIGFFVYHMKDPKNTKFPLPVDQFKYVESDITKVGSTDGFINACEVSARLTLDPGTYVIIPATYEAGKEADFLLRIFLEKRCCIKTNSCCC